VKTCVALGASVAVAGVKVLKVVVPGIVAKVGPASIGATFVSVTLPVFLTV
jgi:hypothetical protein